MPSWERRAALHLPGLSCRACARRAEAVLRRTPGVVAATVRFVRERAEVRFDARATSESHLAARMDRAGYAVSLTPVVSAGHGLPVDLGIGLAALATLLLLRKAGDAAETSAALARLALAAVALVIAGIPLAGRAVALLRRGILTRELLAGGAAVLCFAAGVVGWAVASQGPPGRVTTLGLRAAGHGAGFEAAAGIAVAALAGHLAERALLRRALARRAPAPEGDAEEALDAAARAAFLDLAEARVQPGPETWEAAALQGLFTAALACASFAVVTHGWLGHGPLGPLAVSSAAAVLVGMSPASVLAAAAAARTIAVARARAAGVAVRDPRALEALARVDTACFDEASLRPSTPRVPFAALRARGLRTLLLPRAAAGAADLGHAPLVRDLQQAGARVLVVAEGGDLVALAQAEAAVLVTRGRLPAAARAPIHLPAERLPALAAVVDLGRSLRRALTRATVLGAVFNAVLIPAAALGYVDPLHAAALSLAETLLGLAFAARLLRS